METKKNLLKKKKLQDFLKKSYFFSNVYFNQLDLKLVFPSQIHGIPST